MVDMQDKSTHLYMNVAMSRYVFLVNAFDFLQSYVIHTQSLVSASPISDTGTTRNRVAKYFMKEW